MKLPNERIEVMQTLEPAIEKVKQDFLPEPEDMWQPSDLLPDSTQPDFIDKVREIQELAKDMSYDLVAVLIGDTITEEALPTYESWLFNMEGIDPTKKEGWGDWIRRWTAEENRHGDLLNKYLYLSGRVNMKEMELSTQHLISDGFDIGTGLDPYRNFIYTSFQEVATNVSHRRVAGLAKKAGNPMLAKMCGVIAADEARHARAYQEFVSQIFKIDPSEMMLAFEDMMRKKIVMPAHFLRESGGKISDLFKHFSDSAQRMNVYTAHDYIDIMKDLLVRWDIGNVDGLNGKAEKARDFLMNLPDRLLRVADRISVPEKEYEFKWLHFSQ